MGRTKDRGINSARTHEHSSGLNQLMLKQAAPWERCVIFTNRISRQLPPPSRLEFPLPATQEHQQVDSFAKSPPLDGRQFAAMPVAVTTMTCCQPGVFQMAYAAAVRRLTMKRRHQLRRARAMFFN